ncbi:2-C-methyl-D-erythritol 2,4-cyclodiphosphatesynthase [Sphingobium cloacae]|uniref:Bifunctional enzyme IspD/IspF n=2 Tax=Sphingobium cloacae TaxID=120107 RepID=A0A1E1EZK9_9SPHN|nr:2-C-methyl-D-erythritol 2,4-cyclodiphosphatesynthase [Sphingobium cloacae]
MATRDRLNRAALLVAAGQGRRAGGETPKQFRTVAGKAVLAHAFDALTMCEGIDAIFVVIGPGQEHEARNLLATRPVAAFIEGASSRRGSVHAGLEHIARCGGAREILIHDAARPFLPPAVVRRLTDALNGAKGAIPVLPVTDTLVTDDTGMAGAIVPRSSLRHVQTPQAFHFDAILSAHRTWNNALEATDDAQMLRACGHDVVLVRGDERLFKLTYPEDFEKAQALFGNGRRTCVGMGYDVHRLTADAELWLGGVRVDSEFGLAGHSDADVALHAVVDAILGALSDGDIGSHFPPSDPQWKGASSDRFLIHACDRVASRGGAVEHIDLTIICEAPKIGPYREAMRQRIAEIAGLSVERVSVKATTTERLGFAGRREGIAAQAVATLSLPALF